MPRILSVFLILLLVGCTAERSSEDYYQRAQAFLAEQDYDSARIELKNALQKNGSDAPARCLLGRLQLETGNVLDAQKELERGRSLGCDPEMVLPLLAQSYLAQGDFEEVLALESEGLGVAPYAHVLALQGIAALFKGQPEQARELVANALEQAPDSAPAQLAQARIEALDGNPALAINIIEKVLAVEPENDEAWRLKGHTHWRALHLPKAREAFDRAIDTGRLPIADYISRGLINIQMDDYAAAQQDAAALAEIAIHHPGSNYIGGLLLFRAGEYRDAITMLSLGEAAAQKYPLMLFYLAVAHIIDGDAKVAESYAKRFLEMMPDNIEARRLLAVLYMQRDAVEDVEAVLRPVLDFDANDLGALNIMANALLRDDRSDLSMFTFDWITKTYPDVVLTELLITDGLFTSRLALSAKAAVQKALKPLPTFPREDIIAILGLLKDSQYEEAVALAESYKWRDLTGVAPHNVLGNVYVAAKRPKAAREIFEQALKRKPGDPSANLNLAKLERKANNVEKEREHYEAILRANPDHLPAMLSLAVLEGREGDNGAMADQLREAIDHHPNTIEPRLGLARYYIDSGRPHRVESVFESLKGLQKHSWKVRGLRYNALLMNNKLEEAIALAREEHAYSANTQTLMTLVGLYRSAQQPETAIDMLRGWIEMSPEDSSARLTLAGDLEATDKAAATEQYRAILRYEPDNVLALNNLAWNIRESDPVQALAHIRKAAELAPKRAAVLDSLAVIAHLNGEYEEASVAIASALAQDPDNLSLRYHEAMINAGMGNTKDAVAALKYMLAAKGSEFEEREQAAALLEQLEGTSRG